MEDEGMRNVGEKINESGEEVGKWLKYKKDVFHPVGPLKFVH
jgi:hypothetical protein